MKIGTIAASDGTLRIETVRKRSQMFRTPQKLTRNSFCPDQCFIQREPAFQQIQLHLVEKLLSHEGVGSVQHFRSIITQLLKDRIVLPAHKQDTLPVSERTDRKAVPIASSREGYFYASNAAELYSTIRQLKEMRAGLDAAICGLEQAMETFTEPSDGGGRDR